MSTLREFAEQEIRRLLSDPIMEEFVHHDATTNLQALYTMQESDFHRLRENLEQVASLVSNVLHDEDRSKIYGSFLNSLREIAVARERLAREWKNYSV